MNIYVGNLPYSATDSDIQALFEAHGEVASVRVITDRETQRSRGIAFVEMPNDEDGQKAIDALDGNDFDGRAIKVNKAIPKEDRPRRDRGGFGGGGGGGGGGYGGGRGGGGGGRY